MGIRLPRRERQHGTTAATIPRRWPRSATWPTRRPRRSSRTGTGRSRPATAMCSRRRWANSSPTPSDSTTCTAMPGSGARTGMAKTTTANRPQTTQPAQTPEMTVSFVAVPGTTGRATPVPPVASGTRRPSGATAQASALPGLCNHRHWRFFDAYSCRSIGDPNDVRNTMEAREDDFPPRTTFAASPFARPVATCLGPMLAVVRVHRNPYSSNQRSHLGNGTQRECRSTANSPQTLGIRITCISAGQYPRSDRNPRHTRSSHPISQKSQQRASQRLGSNCPVLCNSETPV